MKHCKKHDPVWMFPSRKEVPKERHLDLLAMRLIGFSDDVICWQCGTIGHPIKSRRGGFRWHTWSDEAAQQRRIKEARAEWLEFGLSVPEALDKFLTP